MQLAQSFLEALSNELGFDGLTFNEDGLACFEVSSKIPLQIECDPSGEHLALVAHVGDSPADRREDFFRALMESNFQFEGTRGATLSVEPDTGRVMLGLMVDLRAGLGEALDRFADFLSTADGWVDSLSEPFPPPRDPDPTSPDSTLTFRA